jgi:hypothetical protein
MAKATATEIDSNFDNLEFVRRADELKGAITEYQSRAGKPTDSDTVLKIATEILRKRVTE